MDIADEIHDGIDAEAVVIIENNKEGHADQRRQNAKIDDVFADRDSTFFHIFFLLSRANIQR